MELDPASRRNQPALLRWGHERCVLIRVGPQDPCRAASGVVPTLLVELKAGREFAGGGRGAVRKPVADGARLRSPSGDSPPVWFDGDHQVHDDTAEEAAQRLPHSRRLAMMGRLHRASSPSVTAGQPPPVKVAGQRTRDDGLDTRLRLPWLAAIREWGR
jgi:hypothetical protein